MSELAETYIAAEIERLRRAVRRTRIVSVGAVVGAGLFLVVVTNRFAASLGPVEAASIANGLIEERLDDQTTDLADYAKKQVPLLISQAPSYVHNRIPGYRKDVEGKINSQFAAFAAATRGPLNPTLDKFLVSNKDSLNALLKDPKDQGALRAISTNLAGLFHDRLASADVVGGSISDRLNISLDFLSKLDEHLKRLAANKNLSAADIEARRDLGILLNSAKRP